MEILIENAGKDPIEVEADSWSLKEYSDAHRAAEFTIKCGRNVPIQRYARVVATENRRVLFRGYVKTPKIKNLQTRELTCKGEEDLLLRRYTGRFAYQASTRRLYHAFQSDPPNQAADAYGVTGNVGLLFLANSMIPFNGNVITTGTPAYDWFALGVGYDWLYRLDGLGLDSRIGATDIYAEGTLLPRLSSFTALDSATVGCYSDNSDLYVRLNDNSLNCGFGPKYLMLAENAYDTGVRMGMIDNPDTVLTGNLQLNFDRMMDLIIDLAEFYGLNPRFRRGPDCTYFDALDEPVDSEFLLPEDKIADIDQGYSEDQRVHALVGLGTGSRDVQNIYTPSDHSWKGVWIEETLDVDDGHLDDLGNLKPYTDAEYSRRLQDDSFVVVPAPDWEVRPRPHDMIRLRLNGEAERLLQVCSAKIDSSGKYEMELGARGSDLIDAFNSRDSLSRIYYEEYKTEFGKSISTSGTGLQMGDIAHGECSGASANVTIPASAYEADWSHRVTLDLSIKADQKPVSCMVYIQINGSYSFLCQPRHYLLNDQITGLDITRFVNYGTATTINIWVQKNGEWDGASCAAHPTMDVSTTIRCWKRAIIGENLLRGITRRKLRYTSWKEIENNVRKWTR